MKKSYEIFVRGDSSWKITITDKDGKNVTIVKDKDEKEKILNELNGELNSMINSVKEEEIKNA